MSFSADRVRIAIYGTLAAVYVLFRIGSFSNMGDRVTDTAGYERVAGYPPWSWHFWAGIRGFTIPLFYAIVRGTESRIVVQLVISIAAWLILAGTVAGLVRSPRLRYVAFACVLVFSLTTEVILWDTLLLSESVTFSLTALLIAAWLRLVRAPSARWAAIVLLLSLLWAFARDTNAYVVLFAGILCALAGLSARHRRLKLVLAGGCAAVFLLNYGSAEAGKRWLQPMRDIVAHRVVPSNALRGYFVARGLDLQSNWPRSTWMKDRARNVYAGYLLRHPGYTLTAPFHGRQSALYSTPRNVESVLDPSIGPYNDNASHRFLTLPRALERMFFPRGVAALLALTAFVLVAAGVLWRLGVASALWLVPLAIVVTTYPHLVVVWHESGVEVDRHAFEAALLLRLAILLLGLFAVDAAIARYASETAASSRRDA